MTALKLIEGKKEKETEQKSEVQTEREKSSKIKRENDDNFSERGKDDDEDRKKTMISSKRTISAFRKRLNLSDRNWRWG